MGRFKRNTKTRVKSKKKLRNEQVVKAPLYSKLFKDVSLSLKRKKRFGDYIYSFHSPQFFLANDDNWIQYVRARNGRRTPIHIGDTILFTYPRCHSKEFFGSILNRLIILNFTTLRKRDSNFELREVLQSYAEDQFPEENKKVYPNELVFSFLIGIIFAGIGMVIVLWLATVFFKLGLVLFYSCLWTMVLGGFWLALRHHLNTV